MISILLPYGFSFLLGIFFGRVGRKYIEFRLDRKGGKLFRLPAFRFEPAVGLLYTFLSFFIKITPLSIFLYLYVLLLLELAIIDFLIYEIPLEINLTILLIGVVYILLSKQNLFSNLGSTLFYGSIFLAIYWLTKGRALGGGDVKFIFSSSFFFDFYGMFLAIFIALLIALSIQFIRMKFFFASREFALGPYLAFGCLISLILKEILFF